jgi:hypothetical protein
MGVNTLMGRRVVIVGECGEGVWLSREVGFATSFHIDGRWLHFLMYPFRHQRPPNPLPVYIVVTIRPSDSLIPSSRLNE